MVDVITVEVEVPAPIVKVIDLSGPEGDPGATGWSPVLALVADGARRVQQVVNWQGGEGLRPPVGKYVGAAGLVDLITDAVDVRGSAGLPGAQGEQGIPGEPGAVIIGEGAEILTGDGPPSDSIGVENQLYLDEIAGDLYKKGATTWGPPIANIKGPQGIQGAKGDPGDEGIPGAPGVQGTDGWSPLLIAVNDGTRRVLQLSDWIGGAGTKRGNIGKDVASTGYVTDPALALGIRGPAGAQGVKGDQGIQGIQGTAGAPGPTITDKGQFNIGTTYDQYDGVHDPDFGYYYSKHGNNLGFVPHTWDGLHWTLMARDGTDGLDGNDGAPGAPGTPGNDGAPGAPGTRGSIWFIGAGAPGTGLGQAEGDTYLNSSNSDVYLFASGSWGTPRGNIRGLQGLQGTAGTNGTNGTNGTDGVRGSVWFFGTTDPGTITGQLPGDSYLNTTTGDVFLRGASSWGTAIGNLRGPEGPQGAPGSGGGSGGGSANPYRILMKFNTATSDADPGDGKVALSSATLINEATIYIDLADQSTNDLTAYLDALRASDGNLNTEIRIFDQTTPTRYLTAMLRADTVTATGYRKLSVEILNWPETLFANNANVYVQFDIAMSNDTLGIVGADGYSYGTPNLIASIYNSTTIGTGEIGFGTPFYTDRPIFVKSLICNITVAATAARAGRMMLIRMTQQIGAGVNKLGGRIIFDTGNIPDLGSAAAGARVQDCNLILRPGRYMIVVAFAAGNNLTHSIINGWQLNAGYTMAGNNMQYEATFQFGAGIMAATDPFSVALAPAVLNISTTTLQSHHQARSWLKWAALA